MLRKSFQFIKNGVAAEFRLKKVSETDWLVDLQLQPWARVQKVRENRWVLERAGRRFGGTTLEKVVSNCFYAE